MRVLQVNNFAYLKGGSEKVMFETIDVLRRHGHDVCTFSMADDRNRDDIDGRYVYISPYEKREGFIQSLSAIRNFFYNKDVERAFVEVLEDFRPDIIHMHIVYGRLTNAVIKVAARYGIPIVQSVHEFRLICPTYTCLTPKNEICEACAGSLTNLPCVLKRCSKGNLANSILVAAECKYRDWFHRYQKHVEGFIMVSRFIMDRHLEHFPDMNDKCFQIYNAIDTKSYGRYVNSEKLSQERYFLYFGRLSYEKGVMTLLDYFERNPHLNLKVAGTGPLMDEMKERISERKMTNVDMLGYRSGEDLYKIIADAYFTIVPSEWYENNPLTVIESLALGTPVIGNRIGGIPEIISDGETGYVYDYKTEGDFERCMEMSLSLPEESYGDMTRSCLDAASEMFDGERYYERLMEVYKRVIEKNIQ